MTAQKPLILCVDDEPQIRELLKKFFSARGYQVRVASDDQQPLALVDLRRAPISSCWM